MLSIILELIKNNPQVVGTFLIPALRATADALEKNPALLEDVIKKVIEYYPHD
jgi:hypothetical protein